MKIIHNIRLPISSCNEDAVTAALRQAKLPKDSDAFVYRRSLDARRNEITYVYSVAVRDVRNRADLQELDEFTPVFSKKKDKNVYIIGFGPAGMFCAYALTLAGLCPVVVERGKPVEQRAEDIDSFFSGKTLDPDSNVRFGEGGAGTFSDGKLTTRINDPRCRFILETFVRFGAPEEILYLAKPHIGTDILRKIMVNLRNEILSRGGRILYSSKFEDLDVSSGKIRSITVNGERLDAENVVLAIGNGADDTYSMLLGKSVMISAKPFSVGFRMEHLQSDVNSAIYGKYAGDHRLGAADYSFYRHLDKARTQTVYTFCMCPGGQVINSSSEPGRLVTNGMSYHARDGKNANSALLATVSFDTPQQGLDFRKEIEKKAYDVAGGFAPVTLAKDFLSARSSSGFGRITPTFLPGTQFGDFDKIFPAEISGMLRSGLAAFGKSICESPDAVLTAPETGSSSPLRILRNEEGQALGIKGFYPCGEGAGYAGGIMSSAVDGLRIAESILKD